MGILIGSIVAVIILVVFAYFRNKEKVIAMPPNVSPAPPNPPFDSATCDAYLNNTGKSLTGINYTECGGINVFNQTVEPNQSIYVQKGTLNGGDSAYLINLHDAPDDDVSSVPDELTNDV